MEEQDGQNPLLKFGRSAPVLGRSDFHLLMMAWPDGRVLVVGHCCGRDGHTPFLKQLLRPEALEVFAEWKSKPDKVLY